MIRSRRNRFGVLKPGLVRCAFVRKRRGLRRLRATRPVELVFRRSADGQVIHPQTSHSLTNVFNVQPSFQSLALRQFVSRSTVYTGGRCERTRQGQRLLPVSFQLDRSSAGRAATRVHPATQQYINSRISVLSEGHRLVSRMERALSQAFTPGIVSAPGKTQKQRQPNVASRPSRHITQYLQGSRVAPGGKRDRVGLRGSTGMHTRRNPIEGRNEARSSAPRDFVLPAAPMQLPTRHPTAEHRHFEHRNVLPIEIVYRQRDRQAPAAPAVQPSGSRETALPGLDVSQLSSEVMRRINKQVRVERERLGRL